MEYRTGRGADVPVGGVQQRGLVVLVKGAQRVFRRYKKVGGDLCQRNAVQRHRQQHRKALWHVRGTEMKAPELMLQADTSYGSPDNYEVILPLGAYTSGTYTIPSGRSWSDFGLIAVIVKEEGAFGQASQFVTEQFNDAGWVNNLGLGFQEGGSGQARVAYVSATQFSVTTSSSGQLAFFYGYLK